jgi:hypothetical protein
VRVRVRARAHRLELGADGAALRVALQKVLMDLFHLFAVADAALQREREGRRERERVCE